MSNNKVSMRSDLARVRGLGPAHDGVGHWWAQRLTALALVPLTLWFVASVVGLAGADHATVAEWIARPLPAVLLVLLIVATFHHAQLGVQVVIEDYVHVEGLKVGLILAVKGLSVLLAVMALFAVLRIFSWGS
ncbi:MAG: succinate dehydrogenase, hydrophobic membrane anchor protein [Alphaproteobacteria bacterium]|nr:succinate dehydrogenase, hydrophobic membrane anchor protein [Alphaproteobacteria bacterium]